MRFLIIRKADEETEADAEATPELFEAMASYNEELMRAGVMVDGSGLRSSRYGAKVSFADGKPTVTDGPFTEARELVAGFTVIEVGSKEEAIEWAKRWPPLDGHGNVQLEIRQVFGLDDFGDSLDDEMRARFENQPGV